MIYTASQVVQKFKPSNGKCFHADDCIKMMKLYSSQRMPDDVSNLLLELEQFFEANYPHGEFHTKIYDTLNKYLKTK